MRHQLSSPLTWRGNSPLHGQTGDDWRRTRCQKQTGLIWLVLDGNGNVLVAVLGDPEGGLNLRAGEHLNQVVGEAGEVAVLELENMPVVG